MHTALFLLLLLSFQGIAQQNTVEISRLIFEKTNRIRLAKGLKPYKALDSLDQLAQYHSDNMVAKSFYSHVDPDGLTPVTQSREVKDPALEKSRKQLYRGGRKYCSSAMVSKRLYLWRHAFF